MSEEEEIDVNELFKKENKEEEDQKKEKQEKKKDKKEAERSFEELIIEMDKFRNAHLNDIRNSIPNTHDLLRRILNNLDIIIKAIKNLEINIPASTNNLPKISSDGLPVIDSGSNDEDKIKRGNFYTIKGKILGEAASGKAIQIEFENEETAWTPKSKKGLKEGWTPKAGIMQEFGIKGWKIKELLDAGTISEKMIKELK